MSIAPKTFEPTPSRGAASAGIELLIANRQGDRYGSMPLWKTIDLAPRQQWISLLANGVADMAFRFPRVKMRMGAQGFMLSRDSDGFPINVSSDGQSRLILEFGGWFEDELKPSEIIRLIELALSGKVRLRDEYVGEKPSRHTVEVKSESGHWLTFGGITYFRWMPNWRVRSTELRFFNPTNGSE